MATRVRLGAACAALLIASLDASADDWTSTTGGTYSDNLNWLDGTTPSAGEIAIFDLGSIYTVDFTGNQTAAKALIRNDGVTFDLGGFAYNVTSSAYPQASLTVGELDGDLGTLTLTNGSMSAYYIWAGVAAGSEGTLTVSTGASLSGVGTYLGEFGTGRLNIENGGTLTNTSIGLLGRQASSSATATVDGAGSSWQAAYFYIGYGGGTVGDVTVSNGGSLSTSSSNINYLGYSANSEGSLALESGGTATLSGMAYVGYGANSAGTVGVDGTDSKLTVSSSLIVGNSGHGSLTVDNGGWVDAVNGYVGLANTPTQSVATVRGPGSQWTNSNFLEVRYGVLNIEDGGTVTTEANYGYLSSTLATVNVDGANSSWDIANYLLNSGQLHLSAGGRVTTGTYAQLQSGSTTTVSGTNSSLQTGAQLLAYGALTVADNAEVDVTTILDSRNELNVASGGSVTVGGDYAYIYSNSTATVDGPGSRLDVTNNLWAFGIALDVTDGGAVTSSDVYFYNNMNATIMGGGASLSGDAVYVGGTTSPQSTGTLNINPGGVVNAGLFKTWSPGIVNLNGGTLNVETLDVAVGQFNFFGGALNFTEDFLLGSGGPLGNALTLGVQQSLSVMGTATILGNGSLTLDGGTFSFGDLIAAGVLDFNGGTLNLTGPNGLTIGSNGLFGQNLTLGSTQTINVSADTAIESGAVLTLNGGTLHSNAITNDGDIVLNGAASRIGSTLVNNSLLRGSGRVESQVANAAGAEIRVGDGESLRFTAAGNDNAGRIEVIGGEIEFDEALTNQGSTGTIVGRDAVLRFNGGLDNQGSVGLSFGTSDVFGDIVNTGSVVVSGNGNATFYDDYTNDGVTQVSAGSNAVFFGAVSGAGSYTGSGSLFFEGDLAPGNSPALTAIAGSVFLGSGLTTFMELGGTVRGNEYDAFDIAGSLSLDGTLQVDLINAFSPSNGDVFDLFVADEIIGTFAALFFPMLPNGLEWDLTLVHDFDGFNDLLQLSVSAVPLPPAVWLLSCALLPLLITARRHAGA